MKLSKHPNNKRKNDKPYPRVFGVQPQKYRGQGAERPL
jgi:hypothetical protein